MLQNVVFLVNFLLKKGYVYSERSLFTEIGGCIKLHLTNLFNEVV